MTRFAGTYYDGLTTQATPVSLQLDDANVLHVDGLPAPVAHPLASVRISARLGNTTRALYFPDGAKCDCADNLAVDELERRAGKAGLSRLVHALESRWRYALLAGLLLVLLLVGGAHWGIPFLARRAADAMPAAMAQDLGRGTLEVLDRTLLKPSELPQEVQQRIEGEFAVMARHYPELPLSLHFRGGAPANAFALPDGGVVVTDALVQLSTNDEQVLAVLAHEIGHVHHRHALRMALEGSTLVLLSSAYFGDVTQLTTLSTALPSVYTRAAYSRDCETEADTFALHYLDESHIPRQRFADIMRALQREMGGDSKGGLQYLASHPPTSERIKRFESR
ncbi:MAG: M48 family metallopeptidase [Myxococcales bacterium]